jgi:hypothetical protein
LDDVVKNVTDYTIDVTKHNPMIAAVILGIDPIRTARRPLSPQRSPKGGRFRMCAIALWQLAFGGAEGDYTRDMHEIAAPGYTYSEVQYH